MSSNEPRRIIRTYQIDVYAPVAGDDQAMLDALDDCELERHLKVEARRWISERGGPLADVVALLVMDDRA